MTKLNRKEDANKTIQYLDDEPTADDYLETHSNTANTIVEIINNNKDGLTIGLQGKWGSGKSSIIEKIRSKTKEDTNVLVFEFNSWAHEKENHRQAFLLELIDSISENSSSSKKNKLKQLKIPLTNKISKKRLTITGFLISISLLIMTLAINIISKSDFSIPFEFKASIQTEALWGIIIIGIVLLLYFLFTSFFKLVDKYKNNSNILDFYNSSDSNIENQSSSYTFKEHFKQIVNCSTQNKIVLVLDNMDRIEPNETRALWQTMQIFIDVRSSIENKNIWIIVPYDEKGLKEIWRDKADKFLEGGIKEIWNDKADSFLEKSFDLIININKARFSNQTCLMRKYITDCKLINDNNLNIGLDVLLKVLEKYYTHYEFNFEPRELKSIINYYLYMFQYYSNLGSEINGEDIRLKPIFSLYVILVSYTKISSEGIFKHIIENTDNKSLVRFNISKINTKNKLIMSGMCFNTFPDNIKEYFIKEKLHNLLANYGSFENDLTSVDPTTFRKIFSEISTISLNEDFISFILGLIKLVENNLLTHQYINKLISNTLKNAFTIIRTLKFSIEAVDNFMEKSILQKVIKFYFNDKNYIKIFHIFYNRYDKAIKNEFTTKDEETGKEYRHMREEDEEKYSAYAPDIIFFVRYSDLYFEEIPIFGHADYVNDLEQDINNHIKFMISMTNRLANGYIIDKNIIKKFTPFDVYNNDQDQPDIIDISISKKYVTDNKFAIDYYYSFITTVLFSGNDKLFNDFYDIINDKSINNKYINDLIIQFIYQCAINKEFNDSIGISNFEVHHYENKIDNNQITDNLKTILDEKLNFNNSVIYLALIFCFNNNLIPFSEVSNEHITCLVKITVHDTKDLNLLVCSKVLSKAENYNLDGFDEYDYDEALYNLFKRRQNLYEDQNNNKKSIRNIETIIESIVKANEVQTVFKILKKDFSIFYEHGNELLINEKDIFNTLITKYWPL